MGTLFFRKRPIIINHGKGNEPKAIVIHETDNESPSAGAYNHSVYFATPNVNTSCHYVVDAEEIIQLLDHDQVAWHCGKPLGEFSNRNTIGIEICVNKNYDKAYLRAALLTGALMKATGIRTILRHRDVSGKNCPRIMNKEKRFKEFCRIAKTMGQAITLKEKPPHEKAVTDGRAYYGFVCAKKYLNVRSARGKESPLVGTLKPGQIVRLLYLMNHWWSIDYGEDFAFVHEHYLKIIRI